MFLVNYIPFNFANNETSGLTILALNTLLFLTTLALSVGLHDAHYNKPVGSSIRLIVSKLIPIR